ncbi:Predicted DNA-binding transcriptional regulator YafY, contains an HTH and WYL domains [Salinihabitans flavidus]|uniref:Predicted DNA-binding transcriptional regulator YafY, contains an HTH and WYL domains n=1 Tax=Salinihabitans flavidus TaxID=569882 RepID=A0A1H8N8L2_9RHOB|nr:WYL domain-containing protein [Salinihabitans flavidus]SEO25924.1 Predicted DNA-binding transcriptional regulator YafY, contains an HTH and WYL domains [Salinihabitans flavidus]
MKRSDRLYALIEILKDGRLHRAEDLARTLDVSLRTIYRDMDTLAASGVPVEGARGMGYWAGAAITLPPLNLTPTELEALHLGLAAVAQGGEDDLPAAARSLAAKIDAVLPEDRHVAPASFGFAVYPFADAAKGFRHLASLRNAVRHRQKLRLTMQDGRIRQVRPLKLDYWGRIWTLLVWCDTTGDFTSLRVDQMETVTVLPGLFVDEPGKRLRDYRPDS